MSDNVEVISRKTDDEKITDRDLPLSFVESRHTEVIEGINCLTQTWRMKERMKTVSVALVLCLNVGVDPPDIVKTQPCARLECWIDPLSMSPAKALEAIGNNLQKQYERWQPRARYKQTLDPTTDEVKKLCTSLRRNAKEERVLFHYNGHGVPKPTSNGEIWVFNRTYTQYIPLSVYDLQSWMGAPSIYVYDCSNAGIIVDSFKTFAEQHENEYKASTQSRAGSAQLPPSYRNCIQLAACSATQVLPMNPDLPADLFTSCLTTPIKVAVRWFVLRYTAKLVPQITLDMIDKIPGQLTDRRTMLGELNWIFTAITDTIAWNTLPRELFQKLFRQDLLVASLFRNFLLAERILRSFDCTPISFPALPDTSQHPMWLAWDFALDLSLSQLPRMIINDEPYQHLAFFEEQLTAFQVWLELGSEDRYPPEQLPIVLQVLLSQVHRMRALELLGKFLDLGPWAVNLALSVGIFPYVLKLLQSCAKELRPLLVFIWAKILAVDNTCQADLVRDKGHNYFLSVLQDPTVLSEYRTQAAFVLACIVHDFRDGQEAARQGSLVSICLEQLSDPSPSLRQWVAICLARLWDHYDKARWTGVRDIAHEKLYILLQDPCPEVRAAAVYALGTFINSVNERSEHANNIDHSIVMMLVNTVSRDMSSLVRKELVAALQWIVIAFENAFLNVAAQENNLCNSQESTPTSTLKRIGSRSFMSPLSHNINIDYSSDSLERLKRVASSSSISSLGHSSLVHHGSLGALPYVAYGSVYLKIWAGLCSLETDPHPQVAQMCTVVTTYIRNQVKLAKEQAENRVGASMSLPPSPNRGSNYLTGESPPTLHPNTDLHRFAARSAMNNRARKKQSGSTIGEEIDSKDNGLRKPLVTTEFVPWASKFFAQPLMQDTHLDVESQVFYEREWRFERNSKIRTEAHDEQLRVLNNRLESQLFSTRCAAQPYVLQFHPYDQQIAVASRDTFAIWDWGRGAKISHCQSKSLKNSNGRITSLEWINGQDVALVMVASDDGSIKLWRPSGSREPTLVCAWQAFNELMPSYKSNLAGVLVNWEQWTQTVITSGDTRVIRLWDAERELRAFDIPTGADCSVTCLDSTYSSVAHEKHNRSLIESDHSDDGIFMGMDNEIPSFNNQKQGLIVSGCADGSVRLFDRRCPPSDARIKTWLEHASWVLGVQLRDNKVISGSCDGDVKIFDIRKNESISDNLVTQMRDMTAFAVHRNAEIYACGSANQNISIHNMLGTNLNIIRFHEGFMGHRIGQVTCLAFHPHKVALAAGTNDCLLTIYCMESRR
ncbi:hypothetical protein RI129_009469 [Pyrocoelia pectoralis]|uniref:Raptor N-terminal CASPase-like domain-containing protein n=1 Tax=Pyrocoelia pectoralis TaxID=417401 RepID=A0AAN7ZEX0_9COLE